MKTMSLKKITKFEREPKGNDFSDKWPKGLLGPHPWGTLGWTEKTGHFQTTGSEVSEDHSGQRRGLLPDPRPLSSSLSSAVSQLTGPLFQRSPLPSPQSLRTKCQAVARLGLCPNPGKPKGWGGLGGSWVGKGTGQLIMNRGQTAAQPIPKGPVGWSRQTRMLGPEEKGFLCLGSRSRRHIRVKAGISPAASAQVWERGQSKRSSPPPPQQPTSTTSASTAPQKDFSPPWLGSRVDVRQEGLWSYGVGPFTKTSYFQISCFSPSTGDSVPSHPMDHTTFGAIQELYNFYLSYIYLFTKLLSFHLACLNQCILSAYSCPPHQNH